MKSPLPRTLPLAWQTRMMTPYRVFSRVRSKPEPIHGAQVRIYSKPLIHGPISGPTHV